MTAVVERVEGSLPVAELQDILACSKHEGFNIIKHLIIDWNENRQRFANRGEALFLARIDGKIVGTGGRIFDPYLNDPKIARVRRVYVMPSARRLGVARHMMQEILNVPPGIFTAMTLRTETAAAQTLYEGLGFVRTGEAEGFVSYRKIL